MRFINKSELDEKVRKTLIRWMKRNKMSIPHEVEIGCFNYLFCYGANGRSYENVQISWRDDDNNIELIEIPYKDFK